MNKKISTILSILVLAIVQSFSQPKPLVYILATGGTIAGVGESETSVRYSLNT